MKKKTVLWAILLFYSLGIFAEQSALLYGNGKVRTFSGENAFRDAYEAAVDGDTITLSPGIFYNPKGDMTKTLYICGSGAYGSDTENTIIDYSLTIRGNDTKIEGIAFQRKGYTNTVYVNADNVSFSRCFINEIDYNDNTSMYSVEHGRTVFTDCCVKRVSCIDSATSISFYNCTVGYFSTRWSWSSGSNSDSENSHIVNCVIYSSTTLPFAIFENNIIEAHNSYGLNASSIFHNNLFYSDTTPSLNFPSDCVHTADMYSTTAAVFKTKEAYPADVNEVPNGSDGKPVGIYGGKGFTKKSSIPYIGEYDTPAFISKSVIFGQSGNTVEVNAVTDAPYLRLWWNDDFDNKQDIFSYITWGTPTLHPEKIHMPASARGKGPQKGVATLHVAALGEGGIMSAPINKDITYAYGPTIEASQTRLTEGDVVTIKWHSFDIPLSGSDQNTLYYSYNGGPWILLDSNPSYQATPSRYYTNFKGRYGTYRFVATVRVYVNVIGYVRTPIDEEWAVSVFFSPKN